MITGTVSLTNSRLSLVDGKAFADFSAAGTLNYPNAKLTLTDSAGKKAIGYIKAAGTGETYGNELVTNGDMSEATGWTGTGWEIGSGIATATAASNFLYRTLSNTPGQLLKWSFNLLSRTAGSTGFRRHNVGTVALQTVPAIYTGYKVDTSAGVSVGVDALAFSGTVDDISCKAVTSPSPTGVTIVSTRGGTTYNWASIEAGFNYNDASGYTYEIMSPRFKKSKFISQYNYFYRRNR